MPGTSKVAALYDIHGNLPALEAVLAEVAREKVDAIVVGGDVVPGPMPRETLARLLELNIPTQFILGNGDRVALAAMRGEEPVEVPSAFREVIWWNARQLGPAEESVLASWPKTLSLEIAGLGRVLFCHATPRNDVEIFTRETSEEKLAPVFAGVDAELIVCGHTHMQFDRLVSGKRVVNAGSVGMPFAEPGAYWLLLGPDVELRRTSYDLEAAAARVRATEYPQAEQLAAGNILRPPREQEMLKVFAGMELK
jgi:putative phosphoesterase